MTGSALVKIRVKAVRVGNSVRVVIPVEVLKASGIRVGDQLLIDYDEKLGKITIEKAST